MKLSRCLIAFGAILLAAPALADAACVAPPNNMVLWLPLDETSGTSAFNAMGGHNGTHAGSVTAVPGKVGNAASFNNSTTPDRVEVPSYPAIEFSTGDFSFDAWVKPDSLGTILNKYDPVTQKGYIVFLDITTGGPSFYYPSIILGNGFGYSFHAANTIQQGVWSHIAVTVKRGAGGAALPDGVVFYVNGQASIAPDPSPSGSYAPPTPPPLWLGDQRGASPGNGDFNGAIDEVELFDRVLTEAEVLALYTAGPSGKCKHHCHVPWDEPFCVDENSIDVTAYICNSTTVPQTYSYWLQGLPAGPDCSIVGPTSFTPASGTTGFVQPGQCMPITVTIHRPAGMTAQGLVGCYELFCQPTGSPDIFSCRGSVQDMRDVCVDTSGGLQIATNLNLLSLGVVTITNTSASTLALNYQWVVMTPEMNPDTTDVSVNGQVPGTRSTNTLVLAPGTGASVEVTARFVRYQPGRFYTILLQADTDGDGFVEPLASMSLRNFLAASTTTSAPTNCCDGCAAPYPASYSVTVHPGYNYLVNHLCHGTNNLLEEILPIVPDNSMLLKWNKASQTYDPALIYVAGFGWVDGNFDPSTETLPPGEGFVLHNPGAAFSLQFEGCEPDCSPPCAPTGGLCLVGRLGIGPARWTNLFSCPPECGARVSVWNPTNQDYVNYDYLNGAWTPEEPVLAVGASAFVTVVANTNCEPCDLPVITLQPANQTVVECLCVTFIVAATGQAPLHYQWQLNGADIPGATGSSHTLCPVALADNAGEFRVIITNDCGSVTSRVAVLTVTPDVVPPQMISVSHSCCDDRVYVRFSERVDAASAIEIFNYELSGGGVIHNATLLPDGRTVCLETSPLTPGASYTLTANGVMDCAGNQIAPGSQVHFSASAFTKGYVLRQWWDNVPGNDLSALTGLPAYPVWPDRECPTNLFELNSANDGDFYGARISGWFCAPVSGEYRFYLASDDRSELYLSSDAACANKIRIAFEPQFAGRREWTGTAGGTRPALENVSAPVSLTASQRYYIEAIVKEGGGGDHLGVAVQLPGDLPPVNGSSPIPGQYLGTCLPPTNGLITIIKQPADAIVSDCCNEVCFMVSASGGGACGLSLSYQWQRNGVDIPGATGDMYCLTNASLADSGAQFRVIISLGAQTHSSQIATLTALQDVMPPALVSASVDCVSNKFTLVFSECLDPLSAQEVSNLIINDGAVIIQSALLLPDGRTVCLFTESLGEETEFNISAFDLTDQCGNTAPLLTATVRCPCLLVLNEQITCSSNAPGKLSYSFDLANKTGVPVTYLYLVPKSNCFTLMPGILIFRPALAPGATTNLSVMINVTNNCSSNLCFVLAAHDSNFVECCSIQLCVDPAAGPRLLAATPDCTTNKITVTFSTPLDPATVLGIPNFIVDDLTHMNSLVFAGASFGPDYKTVCLYTSAPLSPGTQYRLTVNNVRDTCGNLIASNSQAIFDCPGCIEATLFIQLVNGQVIINWTGGGQLQCASQVTGPWADVPGATNPYTTPALGAHKFYRVRCP